MKSTFNVIFYLRKNEVKKNGNCGVMVRITIDGDAVQFNTKLEAPITLWNAKTGKLTGKSPYATNTNLSLDNIRLSILQHFKTISERESMVTAEKVKNAFLGIQTRKESLLEVFKKYVEDIKVQVGKGKSAATLQKYNVTYTRLQEFMQYKYSICDIALKEITHLFIHDFEIYLKTIGKCSNNTTAKFIQRLRSIILLARNNGWIYVDPFLNYKIRLERVDRNYLTQEQLNAIINKEFSTMRLEHVRDIFIFSCFTGLAYIDVKSLSEDNIQKSFDNNLWIMTKRQKTNVQANIPLLDVPMMILNKYGIYVSI